MRYNTWGYNEEKMRTRLGCSTYCMRCWLRLLRHSRSLSSYPLPMSMLSSGGINRNNTPISGFISPWILDQNLQFSYYMHGHYFFARAYNDLIPVIDGYEVGFMRWTFLEHMDLVSISCCVCIIFLFQECCCHFFPKYGVLFSSGFKGLIMWWWFE